MEIHGLQDIENALLETREEFHKTTLPVRNLLDRAVSLFVEALCLIGTVGKDTDDERHAMEVLVAVFRRVIASVVLLESGLAQEAHMILRNALTTYYSTFGRTPTYPQTTEEVTRRI